MAESFASREEVDVFAPEGRDWRGALERVTHLGIGAHPDDLEFMAYHGIVQARAGRGIFGGVVVTDGAGSVGGSPDLRAERRREQREAAEIGGYEVVVQLGRRSEEAKTPGALAEDLAAVFALTSPRVIYTHNPADRHPTHVAVCAAVIAALRDLPPARRPQWVYGCEVWGDLDWLTEADRVRLDGGEDEALSARLNAVFRSQVAGGKRYDLAVNGRRRAHATFDDPHRADQASMVTLAMDLSPLVMDPGLSLPDFVAAKIDRFRGEVRHRLEMFR